MKLKDRWQIEKQYVNNLGIDDLKFIFSQAEKKLDDTVKVSDLITNRTHSLITIISGVIIALSAYTIQQWAQDQVSNKIWAAIIGFGYLMILVGNMMRNILPNKYYVPGSYPKDLVINEYYSTKFPKDASLLFILMNEIENYEFRIVRNEALNDQRWSKYICSVVALVLMPLTVAFCFLLLEAIRH